MFSRSKPFSRSAAADADCTLRSGLYDVVPAAFPPLTTVPHMYRTLLPLLMALLFAAPAVGQQNTVNAVIDATEMLVGEQVVLHTTVNCNAGSRVRFQGKSGTNLTPGVEIVEISRPDTVLLNDGKRWQITRDYTLTAFDSALYRLPAIEVEVNGVKVQSRGEIALKVNTIDVDHKHPDKLRLPKGPVEGIFVWNAALLGYSFLTWLLFAGIIALALRLSAPRKRTKVITVAAPPSAHAVAMEAIAQLRNTAPESTEDHRHYFTKLTDILRTYLHERFGFNAMEMTTQEIIAQLQKHTDPQVLCEMKELLQTADLVKFARLAPALSTRERSLLQAADYVRLTQLADSEIPKTEKRIVPIEQRTENRKRAFCFAGLLLCIAALFALLFHLCGILWLFLF